MLPGAALRAFSITPEEKHAARGGKPLYEDAAKKSFGKALKPFSVACRNRVGPCLQVES